MNVNPAVILGFIAIVVAIAIVGVICLERLRVGPRGKQSRGSAHASAVAAVIVASSAGSSAGSSCGGASGGGSCA
jgi:hypothetical protein